MPRLASEALLFVGSGLAAFTFVSAMCFAVVFAVAFFRKDLSLSRRQVFSRVDTEGYFFSGDVACQSVNGFLLF